MMTKFLEWFDRYRAPIGYTIGGFNLVSGIFETALGNAFSGMFWLVVGAVILFDTWEYQNLKK
jgi:hypothetical protein